MFITDKAATEKTITRELDTLRATGKGRRFAIPSMHYIHMCMSLGLTKEFRDPDTFVESLIPLVIDVGGMRAKIEGKKELGSTLFNRSTWARYKRIADGREKLVRGTSQQLQMIDSAISHTDPDSVAEFWKILIQQHCVSLSEAIIGIHVYKIMEPSSEASRFLAVLVLDIDSFYWPFRAVMAGSENFINNNRTSWKKLRTALRAVSFMANYTVENGESDIKPRIEECLQQAVPEGSLLQHMGYHQADKGFYQRERAKMEAEELIILSLNDTPNDSVHRKMDERKIRKIIQECGYPKGWTASETTLQTLNVPSMRLRLFEDMLE